MRNLEAYLAFMVLGRKPVRRRRKPRRCGVLRDSRMRKFIRSHPCEVCGTTIGVECAHTGSHGHGIKSGDDTGIALCAADHRWNRDSLHNLGPRRFEKVHGLKIGALVKMYQAEWKELNERRKLT